MPYSNFIRIGNQLLLCICLCSTLSAIPVAWQAAPVAPDTLTPSDPAWETAYQDRVFSMVNAQTWSISNGEAGPDEGKSSWSPLLAEMWKVRDDNNALNSFISEDGQTLLNSRWAGSFYKAFSVPGYNQYYFRFKDYNASVNLPEDQVSNAQNMLGDDATGDPYNQSLENGWAYLLRADHHMDPIFSFTEFNSENFHWMSRLGAVQWAYESADLDLGTTYHGEAIPSSRDWVDQWMGNWVRSLFASGRVEWNSNNYWSYTFNPITTLYDLPPGQRPVSGIDAAETAALRERVHLQTRAAADWMTLENALHYLDGFRGGPDSRAKHNIYKPFFADTWAWMYAQFAGAPGTPEHPTFSVDDAQAHVPSNAIGFIAWTDYRPLQAVLDIAQRRYELPVEIQSAKPHYSLDEDSYAEWDGSHPWNAHPSMADYGMRFEFETLYLDENCLLGSVATFRPDADAEMSSQQNFFSEQNLWRLMVKGSDKGALQVTGTTLPDPGYYALAGRDPWENIGQNGKVMIRAVKRPDGDNGQLMVVPKETTREMDGDVLFVDMGHGVYFAAMPFSSGSISASNSSYSNRDNGETHQKYQWAFPADTFGALVLELGVARDHNNFDGFKSAILANLGTRLNSPASDTVEYLATDGEMSRLEWQKPWTGESGEPSYELSDGTIWGDGDGEAAGVVPKLWRDDQPVDYATWDAYRVVRGEQIVFQPWGGNFLRIAANGSGVEIRIDPVTAEASYHSLSPAANTADSDGDGQPNLLEIAMGSDPNDPSSSGRSSGKIVTEGESEYLALSYARIRGGTGSTGIDYSAGGLNYFVEHNDELMSPWKRGDVMQVGDPIPDGQYETITVRLDSAISEKEANFIRLVVEED